MIKRFLILAVVTINVGCTTNRVIVDDHSYHHNDTPSGTTIINHHYPQTVVQPHAPPSIQQVDRDFLQYQQGTAGVVPSSYPVPQRFTHTYQFPTYTDYSQAYKVTARAYLGM